MDPQNPPPSTVASSLKIGRCERMAMEEIGLTRVRTAHAVVFIGLFLGFLYGVLLWDLPVLRSLPGIAGKDETVAATAPDQGIHTASVLSDGYGHLFAENQKLLEWIKGTDQKVDERSPFVLATQPGVQEILAACGEGGTEVMAGRDGWLFYRPSFRFLTRPAEDLAKPDALTANAHPSMDAGFRASLEQITRFAAALDQRGIPLVVVPVWPKQSIQPECLGGPVFCSAKALMPATFAAWRTAVERAGVRVFDPAAALMAAKSAHGGAAYLKTDSHWAPATMQACAAALARYLTDNGLVTPGSAKATLVPGTITNLGDLAVMLKMPAGSRRFPPERIEITQVRGDKGTGWPSDRSSPVLLLGDSFSNIFSSEDLKWGQDAGFAQHLGAQLGMPLDTILINDGGASATRLELARDLAKGKDRLTGLTNGNDRLTGKKVVVWEFSATQITEGRWLNDEFTPNDQYVELEGEEIRQVTATVAETGIVPNPNTEVYNNYVGYLVLKDLKPLTGPALTGTRAFVYGLVMKDKRLTPAATLRIGQQIRANLRSWESADEEFGSFKRGAPQGAPILQVNWLDDFSVNN